MRCGQRLCDVGAGAEAGVDQSLALQPLQCGGVNRRALRLDNRFAINAEAKPVEFLKDAVDELRPAAARVEILDADPEFARTRPRMGMAQGSRKGMTQVQASGRRRGETCDLQDSLHDKADRGDS